MKSSDLGRAVVVFWTHWIFGSVVLPLCAVSLARTEGDRGFYAFVLMAPVMALFDAGKKFSEEVREC